MGAAGHPDRRSRRPAVWGSMNDTPSLVGDRDPGQVDDLDAGQRAVGDRGFDGCPGLAAARAAQDDRGAGRCGGEAGGVVGGVAAEQLGQRRGDRRRLVDRRDGVATSGGPVPPGRGPRSRAGRPCPARSPSPTPTVVSRVVGGGDDGRAVLGDEQVRDGMVDLRRARPARGRLSTRPGRSASGRGSRCRPSSKPTTSWCGRSSTASGGRARRPAIAPTSSRGSQVVGPDLVAGRDVDPLAGAARR